MGKKRSEIKVIDSKKSRKDTFHKRKFGLLKKASELSMLCNLKLLLFFEDLTGKLIQYSSQGNYDPVEYFELNRRKRTVISFTSTDYPDFFHKPAGGRIQVKQEGDDDDHEDIGDMPGEENQMKEAENVKHEHLANKHTMPQKMQEEVNDPQDPAYLSRELDSISSKINTLESALKVQNSQGNVLEIQNITGRLSQLLEQFTSLSRATGKESFAGPAEKFPVPQSFGGASSRTNLLIDKRGQVGLQRNRNVDTFSPGTGAYRRDLDIVAMEERKEGYNRNSPLELKFVGEADEQFNINGNGLLSRQPDIPFNNFLPTQSSNLSGIWPQYKNDQASRQSSGLSNFLSREDLTKPVANERLQKSSRDYWTKYGRVDSGMSDMMKQEAVDSMADFFHPQRVDDRMMEDVLGRELIEKTTKAQAGDVYAVSKSFEQLQLDDMNRLTQDLGQYEKVNTSTERREQSFMLFSPLPLSSYTQNQQKTQTEGDWYSQYYQSIQNQPGNLNPAFPGFNMNTTMNMSLNISNLSDNSIMKSPRLEKKFRDNN